MFNKLIDIFIVLFFGVLIGYLLAEWFTG